MNRSPTVIALLLLLTPAPNAEAQGPLRVIEFRPGTTATPGDVFTITFDRPVAGMIEHTFDPSSVVHVSPALASRTEWRDPSTIRVIPVEPLAPGRVYVVRIDSTFAAVDGARLPAPVSFRVTTTGPRLIASFPGLSALWKALLAPDGRLHLAFSAPIDSAAFGRVVRVEFDGASRCDVGAVAFQVTSQHAPSDTDPWNIRYAAASPGDVVATRFRRVVELRPKAPLPAECDGVLVVPSLDSLDAAEVRYGVRTASPFRLLSVPPCDQVDCTVLSAMTAAFSAPLRAGDFRSHVHIDPPDAVTMPTGDAVSQTFMIGIRFESRHTYRMQIDSTLRDVFGRKYQGPFEQTITLGDRVPAVGQFPGTIVVPKTGPATLRIRHVNVDSVELLLTRIPDSLAAQIVTGALDAARRQQLVVAHRTVGVQGRLNALQVSDVPLPELDGLPDHVVLGVQVRVGHAMAEAKPSSDQVALTRNWWGRDTMPTPLALLQTSNLVVHAMVSETDGAVFVTNVETGRPVPAAVVHLVDVHGDTVAGGIADSSGVAVLRARIDRPRLTSRTSTERDTAWRWPGWAETMEASAVDVRAGDDRVLAPVIGGYWGSPDRWTDGGYVWTHRPVLTRATVFTDRGIYRPGDTVFAAGILREGTLAALHPPLRGAEVRWRVSRADPWKGIVAIREAARHLGEAGTSVDTFVVPAGAPLGTYWLEVATEQEGRWYIAGHTSYRVAEYRAPEFQVSLTADSGIRFVGDTTRAHVSARFLFDAPMARALVRWRATFDELEPWELTVPGLPNGFELGEQASWWGPRAIGGAPAISGEGALDDRGALDLEIPSGSVTFARGALVQIEAAVEDANRQVVTTSTSSVLRASSFALAMRDSGGSYFWRPRASRNIELLAIRPDGRRVREIPVQIAVVRHQWRQGDSAGIPNGAWRWVHDTVTRLETETADTAVRVAVTVSEAGYYSVEVSTEDERHRPVRASLARFVLGGAAIVWGSDAAQLGLVLSADRYRVNDTAAVAFTSPFVSAEAWVVVGRETVLWQRRLRVAAGLVTVPIPVAQSFVPNADVSVLLVRDGPAAARDSLSQRMRRGTTSLHVERSSRRLTVLVRPERTAYAPGDTAAVLVRLTNDREDGIPGIVAIWAVDEGVLSLTGYQRPDPVPELFAETGSSLRFASGLFALRTGDPALMWRMIGYDRYGNPLVNRLSEMLAGKNIGASGAPVIATAVSSGEPPEAPTTVREDVRTTAFFRAFVETAADGTARLVFRLPDNVTTFRAIAVAASGNDQFGSGESPVVSTKPLIVRAALPRFVRPGDEFLAGGIVNARDTGIHDVEVTARSQGIALLGDSTLRLAVQEGGSEARFRWRVAPADSVRVQLLGRAVSASDAVSVRLPVRPAFVPRAHTLAGMVRDRATVTFMLPKDIDPARSHLTLRVGTSPMPTIELAGFYLTHYPYYCTEQLASAGRYHVLQLQLHRTGVSDVMDVRRVREQLQQVVDELLQRHAVSGGFGYWSRDSWTTPWLSAHVGLLLLDARDQGADVPPESLTRLATYLTRSLDSIAIMPDTTFGTRRDRWTTAAARLGDRLAAATFLVRMETERGRLEAQRLRGVTNRMRWEDRIALAHLLRLTGSDNAARALLDSAWRQVVPAGARVDIPDSLLGTGLFASRIRPAARLLSATLAIEPSHPMLGGLVERIVQRARSESSWSWNTQDHTAAAVALAEFMMRVPARSARVELRSNVARGRAGVLAAVQATRGAVADTTMPLAGLTADVRGDSVRVRLQLSASSGPVYYVLTIDEVSQSPPVTPDVRGISVERWYERFDDGRTVTELREGELVRVRLRVTVRGDREFVALEDPLPAGLEAVDLSLRTSATLGPFTTAAGDSIRRERDRQATSASLFGAWDGGWWTPWEHTEKRDDRVLFFARRLWPGAYTATYVARATTNGRFVRLPAHAEEMYNPALSGRSDGGWFRVVGRQ